ncbi:MAG: hypothetical protein EOO47_16720 [Flavobacterium sp.]|nr:MAG: hypothetical protein EOO47_16720 [Flavobacterium sp.]
MIDVVYLNSQKHESEDVLTRDEMKKVVGGYNMEGASCKSTGCQVAFIDKEADIDEVFPGDCDGGGSSSCYCNIGGGDVGPVNGGGISHCTIGH